jgi:dTDP-4-dehydrorhamnose reductase
MHERNEKLLIVGLESLAGSNIAHTLANRCEVVGLSRCRGFALERCRTLTDIRRLPTDNQLSREHVFVSIVAERPHWVVYCGPTSHCSWDLLQARGADVIHSPPCDTATEAELLSAAARAAEQCGAKLALVSTDAVCAGPQVFHSEAVPLPLSHSKSTVHPAIHAARQLEQQLGEHQVLILRTHLYGWSAMGESHAEQLWLQLEDGASLSASGRHYSSPIVATDFAELLWAALHCGLTGLFHAAGAERASQWHFAVALAAASGMWLNKSSHNSAAKRSLSADDQETSLDSRKLQRALGLPLPGLRDGLERFVQQTVNGDRDSLRAAFFTHLLAPIAA